jgi:GGDEF domain-containing protein
MGEWLSVRLHLWMLAFVQASLVFFVIAAVWRRRRAGAALTANLEANLPAALPTYRAALAQMTAELERARRYQHTFAVAVLGLDDERHNRGNHDSIILSAKPALASRFFFSLASSLIRDNLRGCDLIACDATNERLALLLPESSTRTAEQAILRLNRLVRHRAGARLRFGIAEFPADGLIIEHLFDHANAEFHRTAGETATEKEVARISRSGQYVEALA